MITNHSDLAGNELRKKALDIINSGLAAINIKSLVSARINLNEKSFLKILDNSYNLSKFQRIYLIAFGKGSSLFASSVANILDQKLDYGLALDIEKPNLPWWNTTYERVDFLVGTHPLPSAQNVAAFSKIKNLLTKATGNDLIIFLITGGGSSLLCGGVEEMRESVLVTKFLTKAGAPIQDLNIVRKHLSDIKGGGLANLAYPAKVISLIASDVCSEKKPDLSAIASGPTVYDSSTREEAFHILASYGLNPNNFSLRETPKDKIIFKNVDNLLFAYNYDALSAMLSEARQQGFDSHIATLALAGESRYALTPYLKRINPGSAFIIGGETTVTIKGHGRGGRNQEAVLATLEFLSSQKDDSYLVASVASDAFDNTPVAGALADHLTLKKSNLHHLHYSDFLDNNNSFNFFASVGDYIKTTGDSFNVADLALVLRS